MYLGCLRRGRLSSPCTRQGSCRSMGSRRTMPWRNRGSVPTLGVKGFWPWAFLGCRNTSLAFAAGVLLPVRTMPSLLQPRSPQGSQDRSGHVAREGSPPALRTVPPAARANGLVAPVVRMVMRRTPVRSGPPRSRWLGESGSVGGGDLGSLRGFKNLSSTVATEVCAWTQFLSASSASLTLAALRHIPGLAHPVTQNGKPFQLLGSAHLPPPVLQVSPMTPDRRRDHMSGHMSCQRGLNGPQDAQSVAVVEACTSGEIQADTTCHRTPATTPSVGLVW